MINVIMVDSNESSIKEVKKYFSNQSSINIKKSFSDGLEALNELLSNSKDYDVMLLNPIISSIDGIGILSKIEEHNINIKTIIYSDYNSENMVKYLFRYNISFYLLKSVNMDILSERIIDSTNLKYQEYEYKDTFVTHKVSKLLHDLGMPSHIKGYQYIRDAIITMYEEPKYIGGITKKLYPLIAKKYNTTASRVERAIRHAIEVSWSRGDYDLMDEIFGHSVDFDRAKPTNSEFLATLADKITLDESNIRVHNIN